MFCYKCGAELVENSVFCSKCGTKLTEPDKSQSPNQKGDDINRDVLISHLENLLYLECAKYSLSCKHANLNNTIQRLGIARQFSEPEKPDFDLLGKVAKNLIGPFMVTRIALDRKKELDKYNEQMEQYKKALLNDENRVREENKKKEELIKVMQNVESEWSKVNATTEKAYSINIIPKPFRSLASVHYLYDYLSTSNEPFSDALFHCDLDVIKKGLRVIAQQQQQILINQAIMISQNEEIIHQNNEKIMHLARIEESAVRAEQYSKVAASNAETCALYLALSEI